MTRDDIIRMAREAGAERNSDFSDWSFEDEDLERFAALVAAAERKRIESRPWGAGTEWIVRAVEAEREACAMECIKLAHKWTRLGAWGENNEFHDCAAAIRARGQA
jgi:hypothetical protein